MLDIGISAVNTRRKGLELHKALEIGILHCIPNPTQLTMRIRSSSLLSLCVLCSWCLECECAFSFNALSSETSRRRSQRLQRSSISDNSSNDRLEKKQSFFQPVDLTPVAFGTSPDALPPPPPLAAGKDELQLPLYQLALAGSLTTLIADVSMHPVDCIKTLQQSDVGIGLSLGQAAQQLWDSYGLLGFYHGFITYGVSDGSGGALKFAVWELWKQQSKSFPLAEKLSGLYILMGAALAFVASSVLIVPGELLKQNMQMGHYDSLLGAVHGIYTTSGLPGFFTGYEGVLYRDIPYTMLELGLYDLFKSLIDSRRPDDKQPSAWEEVAAAAATGGITATMTTPIDVVKTKLMVDAEYSGDS